MTILLYMVALVCAILPITLSAQPLVEKPLDPTLNAIYLNYCNGNFDSVKSALENLIREDPNHITAQLMYLDLVKGAQRKALTKAELFDGKPDELAHLDRVLLAEALMIARSTDFSRMRDLLQFRADYPILESYRLAAEAGVDLFEGASEKAIEKTAIALKELPFLDLNLLHTIFSVGLREEDSLGILKPYRQVVENIPESNPNRAILVGDLESLQSGERDYEKTVEYFRKSYEMCPYDMIFATDYAILLAYDASQRELAESILLRIISDNDHYYAHVDWILSEIYFELEEYTKGRTHLEKAMQSLPYFAPDERQYIITLNADYKDVNSSLLTITNVLASLLAAILAGFLLKTFICRRRVA